MQYKHLLAAAAVLSLAACSPAATVPSLEDESSSSAMTDNSSSSQASSVSEGDDAMAADVRVVDITATDWSFTPSLVTVKKGEKVQLRLNGDKGIHSLVVAQLGLNVRLEAGQSIVVDVPTDTTGSFEGRCGVPCGPGHRDMKFVIVVE